MEEWKIKPQEIYPTYLVKYQNIFVTPENFIDFH